MEVANGLAPAESIGRKTVNQVVGSKRVGQLRLLEERVVDTVAEDHCDQDIV